MTFRPASRRQCQANLWQVSQGSANAATGKKPNHSVVHRGREHIVLHCVHLMSGATMSSVTMTIRLSQEAKDALGRLAAVTRRTNSYLAAEAIEAYVAREQAIVEGIRAGIDDVKAGRTVNHDVAMARLEATIAAAERARG